MREGLVETMEQLLKIISSAGCLANSLQIPDLPQHLIFEESSIRDFLRSVKCYETYVKPDERDPLYNILDNYFLGRIADLESTIKNLKLEATNETNK